MKLTTGEGYSVLKFISADESLCRSARRLSLIEILLYEGYAPIKVLDLIKVDFLMPLYTRRSPASHKFCLSIVIRRSSY